MNVRCHFVKFEIAFVWRFLCWDRKKEEKIYYVQNKLPLTLILLFFIRIEWIKNVKKKASKHYYIKKSWIFLAFSLSFVHHLVKWSEISINKNEGREEKKDENPSTITSDGKSNSTYFLLCSLTTSFISSHLILSYRWCEKSAEQRR
jgi:hypothetical protein